MRYLFLLLLPVVVSATELMPWYGNNLEFEGRVTYLFQSYPSVDAKKGSYSSDDHFLTLSLGIPYDRWSVEVEGTCADTHKRHFSADNVRLTGRYRWLDDLDDDCVSFTTGITFTQAWKQARKDISAFHHGHFATEFHAALGKETAFWQLWTSRWWAVLGVGVADMGSPWLRVDVAWEKNFCDCHHVCLFAHSLYGMGSRDLSLKRSFNGYGSIRHGSIDLGVRYTYLLDFDGMLIGECSYRLYARNFPEKTGRFLLRYVYPFGI